MESNLGALDRFARIVIGIALLTFALSSNGGWWGWFGLIPLVTGVAGFCPLYHVLHFSTHPYRVRAR